MAKIRSEDIFDKSLNKTIQQLVQAEKQLITTTKQLATSARELKKAFGESGIKNLTELQKRYQQQVKLSNTVEKNAIDIQKRKVQLEAQQQRATQAKTRTEIQARKEQERLAKQSAKNAREAAKLNSSYSRLSKQLTDARNKAKNLGATYGTSSKQFRQASKEVRRLDANLKKLDASVGQNQRNVGNYKSALGGVKNLLGAAGVAGGAAMAAQALRTVFNVSRKYEKQNAVLAGVLGKTTDEITALKDNSQTLGSTTAFSATQVTALQEELARLGKTEGEIIAMTEGIIDATVALGSETGETAKLVGSTLNAFKLQASDSADVADILTLSTQRSALSFEKLNTTLPIVSSAAAAAEVSLEKTVAMLGQAADRGIDASTSATALRNIFIELSKSGMTLDDALSKIQNSQDRLRTANDLFGKRAAVVALTLADTTKETEDLNKALENAGGTAEEVAEVQLDTLDGQLKLLNSAWEGFILQVNNSESALGEFLMGAVKFATNALTQIANIGSQLDLIFSKTKNMSDQTLEYVVTSGQAVTKEGNEVAEVLEKLVSNYEKLHEGARESITLTDFIAQGLRTEGETIEGAQRIAEFYVNYLEEKNQKSEQAAESQNKANKALKDEKQELTDLIEIQKDLLDQAKEMPGTTEKEVAARNRRVNAIQKEIKRLKELGEVQQVEAFDMTDTVESYKQSFEEMEKIEQDYLDGYLEREQEKRDAAAETEKKKKELREEAEQELFNLTTELGNALFERKNEQLEDELEANREHYDKLLANEKLSEEQRSLLEAERKEKENKIRKEQRENERKQFLFEQAIAVSKIAIETAKNIAANPAFAPFYTTLAAIQTATVLAQTIPKFWKGTESSPEGPAWVGEKGTELIVPPGNKKESWLTDNKPQLANLEKGTQVVSNKDLVDAVTKEGHSQIAGNNILEADPAVAKALTSILRENQAGTERIVKAISKNQRPVNVKSKEIDKLRVQNLKNKLKG